MPKLIIFFLSLFTANFLLLTTAHASDEFSPAYDLTYQVSETGQTMVTQNIHLTNLTTNYYPAEYAVTFTTNKIEQLEAWDRFGPLKIEVKKDQDLTRVKVAFNEKAVGVGKVLNWTLRYQTKEIAKKAGRIWEINIPRASPDENPLFYNLTLLLPNSFKEPAYVYPKPKVNFFWNKDSGSEKGITLAFGDFQGFKFNLAYHLENLYLYPLVAKIALPPDSGYQKIFLQKIEPQPSEITVDGDGNRLAQYFLLPKQSLEVKVTGIAKISALPRPGYQEKTNSLDFQKYLQPQKFWEQSPEIKKIAGRLKTPEAIYQYVVSTLDYDYARAQTKAVRIGAEKILTEPNKAICMEFTDLFVALSRAAGIPAREVDGFAYTADSRLKPLSLITDVLHSWPEYWDNAANSWIQVDPTWDKTSGLDYFHHFDFNHLAFSIRGIDSTNPYPAGSYKSRQGGKDVFVEFADEFPNFSSALPKTAASPLYLPPLPLMILGIVFIIFFLFFFIRFSLQKLWSIFSKRKSA